jgi:ribosome-binding factor A
VTPDLQITRVYYTTLGDERARRDSSRAIQRAAPFLRRKIGARLRLRRVPQLEFFFDESVERGDRIERILQDISAERGDEGARDTGAAAPDAPGADVQDDQDGHE